MSMPAEHPSFPPLLLRLAGAFHPLRAHGMLRDGPAHPRPAFAAPVECGQALVPDIRARHLALFVSKLGQLLGATDEMVRRRLEQDVLDLAVPLQAAGVFEVIRIAHPPLAAMVKDHLDSTGLACA